MILLKFANTIVDPSFLNSAINFQRKIPSMDEWMDERSYDELVYRLMNSLIGSFMKE